MDYDIASICYLLVLFKDIVKLFSKVFGGENTVILYLYTSASQSPDSGLDPDPEGIHSGPAFISHLKSTNYILYY